MEKPPLSELSGKGLRLYLLYPYTRKGLPVPLFLAVALPALLLEYDYLLVLALLHYLGQHPGALNGRGAHLHVRTLSDGDDLGELDSGAHLSGELFHPERVSLRYPVLLAACLHHCVHLPLSSGVIEYFILFDWPFVVKFFCWPWLYCLTGLFHGCRLGFDILTCRGEDH